LNVAAVSVGLFNNVVKQPTKATTVGGGREELKGGLWLRGIQ